MVFVKRVSAKIVKNSRNENTIFVSIITNIGKFYSTAPTGKSVGKYEARPYKKSVEEDVNTLKKFSTYFSKESIDSFNDLRLIEGIVNGHIGANTLIAFEFSILKALSKEKNKEIWQLINPEAKKFPRLVGNCIGGGKHSKREKKPDFQEFLLIPDTNSVREAFEINNRIKKELQSVLVKRDKKFTGEKNDEDAWETELSDKQVLEIIRDFKIPIGIDVASSGFYKRKKYHYANPRIERNSVEQFNYISNIINNFNLFYIEDPFNEDDFENHAKLLKKFPNSLIVGDDLIATNLKRLEKAIKLESINGVIIKPNQNGSIIEVSEICDLAKKNKIKIIFSHRSGETEESILSDLAFGFQADFLKAGITGKEREVKIKRLIEIEDSLNKIS